LSLRYIRRIWEVGKPMVELGLLAILIDW